MNATFVELRRRWAARLSWPARHPIAAVLIVGAVARLVAFGHGRSFWLDEFSLVHALDGRTGRDLFAPYRNSQLAPPGWFAVEWLTIQVLGKGRYTLRLVSFLAGLAGLLAFAPLARRALRPEAAWVAVALFAVAGDLVTYSCEFKPYIVDATVAVAILLGAVAWLRAGRPGRVAWLAAALGGAAAVWLSFPATVMLAAAGALALADAAFVRRDRARAAGVALVVVAWLASFAVEHRVATRMLGPAGRVNMNAFWDFAFLPWPPRGPRDLLWPLRSFLHLFLNPLDFHRPESLDPRLTLLPGLGWFVVGCVSLGRRDRRVLWLCVGPLLLGLMLACVRLYPFHGRLVLYLVPCLLLVIAEGVGAGWTRAAGRGWLRGLIVASVLLFPSLQVLHQLIDPNMEPLHNALGDLRPPRLSPLRYPF